MALKTFNITYLATKSSGKITGDYYKLKYSNDGTESYREFTVYRSCRITESRGVPFTVELISASDTIVIDNEFIPDGEMSYKFLRAGTYKFRYVYSGDSSGGGSAPIDEDTKEKIDIGDSIADSDWTNGVPNVPSYEPRFEEADDSLFFDRSVSKLIEDDCLSRRMVALSILCWKNRWHYGDELCNEGYISVGNRYKDEASREARDWYDALEDIDRRLADDIHAMNDRQLSNYIDDHLQCEDERGDYHGGDSGGGGEEDDGYTWNKWNYEDTINEEGYWFSNGVEFDVNLKEGMLKLDRDETNGINKDVAEVTINIMHDHFDEYSYDSDPDYWKRIWDGDGDDFLDTFIKDYVKQLFNQVAGEADHKYDYNLDRNGQFNITVRDGDGEALLKVEYDGGNSCDVVYNILDGTDDGGGGDPEEPLKGAHISATFKKYNENGVEQLGNIYMEAGSREKITFKLINISYTGDKPESWRVWLYDVADKSDPLFDKTFDNLPDLEFDERIREGHKYKLCVKGNFPNGTTNLLEFPIYTSVKHVPPPDPYKIKPWNRGVTVRSTSGDFESDGYNLTGEKGATGRVSVKVLMSDNKCYRTSSLKLGVYGSDGSVQDVDTYNFSNPSFIDNTVYYLYFDAVIGVNYEVRALAVSTDGGYKTAEGYFVVGTYEKQDADESNIRCSLTLYQKGKNLYDTVGYFKTGNGSINVKLGLGFEYLYVGTRPSEWRVNITGATNISVKLGGSDIWYCTTPLTANAYDTYYINAVAVFPDGSTKEFEFDTTVVYDSSIPAEPLVLIPKDLFQVTYSIPSDTTFNYTVEVYDHTTGEVLYSTTTSLKPPDNGYPKWRGDTIIIDDNLKSIGEEGIGTTHDRFRIRRRVDGLVQGVVAKAYTNDRFIYEIPQSELFTGDQSKYFRDALDLVYTMYNIEFDGATPDYNPPYYGKFRIKVKDSNGHTVYTKTVSSKDEIVSIKNSPITLEGDAEIIIEPDQPDYADTIAPLKMEIPFFTVGVETTVSSLETAELAFYVNNQLMARLPVSNYWGEYECPVRKGDNIYRWELTTNKPQDCYTVAEIDLFELTNYGSNDVKFHPHSGGGGDNYVEALLYWFKDMLDKIPKPPKPSYGGKALDGSVAVAIEDEAYLDGSVTIESSNLVDYLDGSYEIPEVEDDATLDGSVEVVPYKDNKDLATDEKEWLFT